MTNADRARVKRSAVDAIPMWYIRDAFEKMIDADTRKQLRQADNSMEEIANETGAPGPGGQYKEFPEYTGEEPPREYKKAFTHFCNGTRKSIKASLPPEHRRDKVR